MQKTNHIYLVFNPFLNENSVYQSQAHEFYYALKQKVADADFKEAFMYWGKLQVSSSSFLSQDDSAYIKDLNNMIAENAAIGESTNLYITDYHHFWVGKIESVHQEIFSKDHILPFYDNKDVSVWFKIVDFDLVSSEFEETILYLQQLHCDPESKYVKNELAAITPYISGVQFPLIVQDRNLENYFSNNMSLRISKENALIENPKLMGEAYKQVKSFVLTPQTYRKMSHKIRHELLSAESHLIDHKGDSKDIYRSVLASYLKIFEYTLDESLGRILRSEFGNVLYINSDGAGVHEFSHLDSILINQFSGVIKAEVFFDIFFKAKQFGNISFSEVKHKYPLFFKYFEESLIPFIEKYEILSKKKSLALNNDMYINKQEIMAIRNEILGIGTLGILNSINQLEMDIA